MPDSMAQTIPCGNKDATVFALCHYGVYDHLPYPSANAYRDPILTALAYRPDIRIGYTSDGHDSRSAQTPRNSWSDYFCRASFDTARHVF